MQTHARTATKVELFAHNFEEKLHFLEHFLVAADHERKGASGGARRRAGTRRVQVLDSLGRKLLADGAAGGWSDGAAIGDDCARFSARDNAVSADQYLLGHACV